MRVHRSRIGGSGSYHIDRKAESRYSAASDTSEGNAKLRKRTCID
jgi:hypothetical protein